MPGNLHIHAELELSSMPRHVLQEAMRVRPVAATGVTRYTKRAMVLGGCYLPAGTMVNVPFYAVHSLLLSILATGTALHTAWTILGLTVHDASVGAMGLHELLHQQGLTAALRAGPSQPQQLAGPRCIHPGELRLLTGCRP